MFQKKVSLHEQGASTFQIYFEVYPLALPRGIRIKKKNTQASLLFTTVQKNDENSTVNLSVVAGGGGIIGFVLAGYIIVNADVARCFVFFLSFFFLTNKSHSSAVLQSWMLHPRIQERGRAQRKEPGDGINSRHGNIACRRVRRPHETSPPTQQQQQHFWVPPAWF